MRDIWKIVFAVFCALLGAGMILLVSAGPHGHPIQLSPPPSPPPLMVHITGAVNNPGVYQLRLQSRVLDAIESAGGFSIDADTQALNLAAFLEDGIQINVPTLSPTAELVTSPTDTFTMTQTAEITPPATASPTSIFPIDINSASAQELEILPLIGPVRAARIVAYRQSHGLFQDSADIQNVYDINPEVYAAIRDLIVAGGVSEYTPSAAP